MKFLKWFFRTTWFHILWILSMIIYASTWSQGDDKNIALVFLTLVMIILTLGKYKYWLNNVGE
jgi:hypothetical membrane protein